MESFEEVYQKYLKEVYCFLLRLSGDREIAEELTQQTFAIAFEKLENFNIMERFLHLNRRVYPSFEFLIRIEIRVCFVKSPHRGRLLV